MSLRFDQHNAWLVRVQAPRETRPAIDRWLDKVIARDFGMPEPCLIWRGGPLFRVNESTLVRPWRFIWELETGKFAPPGAGWAWSCPNEGCCCTWEHLKYKGQYCKADS